MTRDPADTRERRAAAARFADDRVWQPADGTDWRRLGTDAVAAIVPAGVGSVLDVGCGDGQVSVALRGRLAGGALVVGVDRARPGLRRFQAAGRPLLADADALPFADASFDLVISSEVLEHLPERVLAGAASELGRVARRDVLLSVPNRENLARERMRCRRCGVECNAWGHIRSFDPGALDRLLPDFVRVASDTAGPRRAYNRSLLGLRHAAGRYAYDPTAVCPGCGGRDFPDRERDPLRLLCDGLNLLLNPRKRDRYWLIALYRRRGAAW